MCDEENRLEDAGPRRRWRPRRRWSVDEVADLAPALAADGAARARGRCGDLPRRAEAGGGGLRPHLGAAVDDAQRRDLRRRRCSRAVGSPTSLADAGGDRYPRSTLDEVRARPPDVVLAPSEPYPFAERDVAAARRRRPGGPRRRPGPVLVGRPHVGGAVDRLGPRPSGLTHAPSRAPRPGRAAAPDEGRRCGSSAAQGDDAAAPAAAGEAGAVDAGRAAACRRAASRAGVDTSGRRGGWRGWPSSLARVGESPGARAWPGLDPHVLGDDVAGPAPEHRVVDRLDVGERRAGGPIDASAASHSARRSA